VSAEGVVGGAAEAASPALRIQHLSKTFGGAKALDSVSLTVRPGEIHGLLGQNGSGKSTLIKILAGFYDPDPGASVEIAGRRIDLPILPGGSARLGMSFVHQHLGLVPTLTVLENLLVADIVVENRWTIRREAESRRARDLFARYDVRLDPDQPVSRLSAVQRALLAIVRAVDQLRRRGAAAGHGGVLVLDEPTPFLPAHEVGELFRLIREIAVQGGSVIFVSHDIDEVAEITSRGTVLRDGRVAGTFETHSVSKSEIVRMIVGRHLDLGQRLVSSIPQGEPRIVIRSLSGKIVSAFSTELRRAEVVGLTGLIGSGYDETVALLYGASNAHTGTLSIAGRAYDVPSMTPAKAIKAGCIFIPSDRLNDGAIPALSVLENVSLPVLGAVTRRWAISRARLRENARDLSERFDVRPRDSGMPLGFLSGGNQQKVLLAKWFQRAPELILLDEPTQGVDVGARRQVYEAIRRMTQAGASVLCASADYEQLTMVADRVIVFGRGRAIAELSGDEISKSSIAESCYRANESSEDAALLRPISEQQSPSQELSR
jgi:ribose transport system ATP-binding protein